MEKHLREREYYEDRYDRATVADCRRAEAIFLNGHKKDESKEEAAKSAVIFEHTWQWKQVFLTKKWYDSKGPTIEKWMREDEHRDTLLTKTEPPRNVLCDECYDRMFEDGRTIWERDGKEEVLFFMRCPGEHLPMKGVYADGVVRKSEPMMCPECKAVLNIKRLPKKGKGLKTEYSCPSCSYTEVDDWDFSADETPDPNYAEDRARFCLSGEALKKVQETVYQMEQLKSLVDDMQKRDEQKEEYEAAAKLEKLTIPQVKERITKLLPDTSYSNLTFEKPLIERFVSIEFSVEEMKTDNPRVSTRALKKLIENELVKTNWRLMSKGIDYRLGLLTGCIRAYESEEDMLKLVQK